MIKVGLSHEFKLSNVDTLVFGVLCNNFAFSHKLMSRSENSPGPIDTPRRSSIMFIDMIMFFSDFNGLEPDSSSTET